ncbi:epimerase [Shouchella clausii]|nr:epimerase [Shouchella clausii]
MKHVKIAGGLGFIGFHLARKLLDEGCFVTAVDSLEKRSELKLTLEMELGRNAHFTFLQTQIEQADFGDADVVVYAANNENRDALEAVLRQCQSDCLFVFLSTTDVYENSGEWRIQPVTEYGEVMLAQEEKIRAACTKTGFAAVIIRLPTVYGLHQPYDLKFGRQFVSYEDGTGKTESMHDLLYIDDVTNALAAAMAIDSGHHTIHLGSGTFNPFDQTGDSNGLDYQKAHELLGFFPRTSLAEGIKKYQLANEKWQRQKKLTAMYDETKSMAAKHPNTNH